MPAKRQKPIDLAAEGIHLALSVDRNRGIRDESTDRYRAWHIVVSAFTVKLRRGLEPATQHFSDAPGLRDATPWDKGCLGIKNFADGSDAGFPQMGYQSL